ncbi:MAG: hypothetical protein N3B01_02970 [Verrucomicrobiae bacterium]|nr:hypothetical protein [Verrucomicrobiae bacterium]
MDLRKAAEHFVFRDPRKARCVIDYRQFLTDVTVQNIIRSCRICKEETGGRKIAGVFYGYSFHCAAERPISLSNLGFLGLKQVLESPHVDFLCAPTDYNRRRGGEPGNFLSAYTSSYQLHGKLYWDEADIHTHHARERKPHATSSLAETLAVCERGFGYMLTKGTALWWFTLAGDNTFHDDAIMERIAQMQQGGQSTLAVDKSSASEIAVFADEESLLYMGTNSKALLQPLMSQIQMHYKLATMGAPYDLYLLSDLADTRMRDYKLYLFLNPFYLSDAMREAIKAKVRRNGAVAVWFYAPGYIREDGTFSVDAIHDLTGIRVRQANEEREFRLTITSHDHPITSELTRSTDLGRTQPFGPVFWVEDPQATALGKLAPDGKVGLAVKDFGTWRSVYCASPLVSTGLLRGLARYAGAHVYSTTDDPFFANRNFAMIHTATAGTKQIVLPRQCDAYDLLSGQLVGRRTTTISLDLPASTTRIFLLAAPDFATAQQPQ